MKTVLSTLKDSIGIIESKLSACVLDGSPMLLFIERNGQSLLYGYWNERSEPGFILADVVPDHLCGSFMFSPESAQRNAAALAKRGEKSYYMHWRAFLEKRLETLRQLEANLKTNFPAGLD